MLACPNLLFLWETSYIVPARHNRDNVAVCSYFQIGLLSKLGAFISIFVQQILIVTINTYAAHNSVLLLSTYY